MLKLGFFLGIVRTLSIAEWNAMQTIPFFIPKWLKTIPFVATHTYYILFNKCMLHMRQ